MKKKTIVLCITLFVLLLISSLVTFLIIINKSLSLTIDINPSIEINFNKKNIVKSVNAINDDGKEILSNNYKGKELSLVIENVIDTIVEKGYVEDDRVVVLIYSKDDLNLKKYTGFINEEFEKNEISSEVVIIDKISSEDKILAKKYNISLAKASYINSIKKDNKSISISNLVNKSITELDDTKNGDFYCKDGYILEGTRCLKEVSRVSASTGMVCPRGYIEIDGTCYLEGPIEETNKLVCLDEYTLVNNKCVRMLEEDAKVEYTCSIGKLGKKGDFYTTGIDNADKYYCVDKSNAQAPILRCLTNPGHVMIGGKCANGPAPLINGGCPNGDTVINGGCYTIDDEDQWVCPNGSIYEKSKGTYVDLCPDTFTYREPEIKGYSCNEGFKLIDNKCIKEEKEDAQHERVCSSGYTLVLNDRCVNYSKTTTKEEGLVCSGNNVRLKGSNCITYKDVDAIRK